MERNRLMSAFSQRGPSSVAINKWWTTHWTLWLLPLRVLWPGHWVETQDTDLWAFTSWRQKRSPPASRTIHMPAWVSHVSVLEASRIPTTSFTQQLALALPCSGNKSELLCRGSVFQAMMDLWQVFFFLFFLGCTIPFPHLPNPGKRNDVILRSCVTVCYEASLTIGMIKRCL